MKKTATKSAVGPSWDSAENEAKNNFVGFNEIGDFVYGALLSRKQVPSTLPDKKGELQWIYEVKVHTPKGAEAGCIYHVLDEKKRVIDEPVTVDDGEIISVGGRKMIDSRMARITIGQIFGLKFTEELEAKTRGYNPTKLIKVFTPKDSNGEFLTDEDVVAAQAGNDDGWNDTEKDA